MAVLWLTSEAGEVADEAKKILSAGGDFDRVAAEARMAEELGDVLWMLAECCTLMDINMEDIARAQLAKQERRYAELVKLHDTEGR